MLPTYSTCDDCGGKCYKSAYKNQPDICGGCSGKRKILELMEPLFEAQATDHQTTRKDIELTITLPVTLAWDSEEHDDGRHISIRAATVTPEDLAKAVSEALEDYRTSTEIERKEYP